MLCSRTACGREIPDDAIYCPYCGKKQMVTDRPAGPKGRMPNGSGSVVKRGRTYTIIYRKMQGGQMIMRSKGGFATKAAARAYYPMLANPQDNPQMATVAQLWIMLQKTRKWQDISQDKRGHYATAYKRLAPIHDREIGSLRFFELQDLVEDLPGAFYPKRDAKTVLQKLFDVAVVNEFISPAKAQLISYLELPSKPLTAQDARTPAEMQAIWDDWNAGHDVAGYMLIMAYLGLRTGELMAIDPDAVDLDARCVVGGIKTEAGRNREIPIAQAVLPVVRELLPKAKSGLCAYGIEKLYSEYGKMIERTGIRQLRPYCQRHTCYTRLLEIKPEIPQAVINAIVGHSNGKLADTYGHISLAAKLAAVDAMQMVPEDVNN